MICQVTGTFSTRCALRDPAGNPIRSDEIG